VDDHLRAADGVWSVGDVTGEGAFTHVAMYQARNSGQRHPGGSARDSRLPGVAAGDLHRSQIGAVGLTRRRRAPRASWCGPVSPIPSSARGWIHGPGNDGFIKLIADTEAGVLAGAASAGPAGGEVLRALAVAVHARVPVDVLGRMIYAHPTFHRAIEDAVARRSC
jgi:pyruvate/2-oxoglutarate dehydrogenase complex dihydrolipoamide dehydrogenase (E3) component